MSTTDSGQWSAISGVFFRYCLSEIIFLYLWSDVGCFLIYKRKKCHILIIFGNIGCHDFFKILQQNVIREVWRKIL